MTVFAIDVSTQDGRSTIVVSGEVDLATAPQLSAAIEAAVQAGVIDVVVDLGPTTFFDSSGLRALAEAADRLPARSARLAVICPPENRTVRRVIDLVGLGLALPVVASVEQLDGPDA